MPRSTCISGRSPILNWKRAGWSMALMSKRVARPAMSASQSPPYRPIASYRGSGSKFPNHITDRTWSAITVRAIWLPPWTASCQTGSTNSTNGSTNPVATSPSKWPLA